LKTLFGKGKAVRIRRGGRRCDRGRTAAGL